MRHKILALAAVLAVAPLGLADEVILSNGDKLTGTVGEIAGGKMKFTSPVLGEISIDMANVSSFTTDEPAAIRLKEGPPLQEPITEGTPDALTTESGRTVPFDEVKFFNQPPEKWTGFVVANLSIARGNTETIDAGVEALAELRRQRVELDDRITLGAGYNFSNTGTGDDKVTNEENWNVRGQYDRFFTEKWYGYGKVMVEKDNIANLDLRVTPGVGVGYQWYETPDFNFRTEAGVSYVWEDYDPGGRNDFIALRLAYHVDKRINERVSVFHNLEYLPAFEDFGDFLMNADAGVQADITKQFFTQAKVEWTYDSTPAENRSSNDYRFLVGVGWRF